MHGTARLSAATIVAALLLAACSGGSNGANGTKHVRTSPEPVAVPSPPATSVPTTLPPPPAAQRTVAVRDTAGLRAALRDARHGDEIVLADGTYTGDPQLEAAADGTAAAPVTLRGGRGAVLTTGSTRNGSYGLHVTGDHWRLVGFSVHNAKKGIVLDGSVGSVLQELDVSAIGQEAVHFRSGSADGAILDSDIHDTGLRSPQFGEGIYVGSANSNWDQYGTQGGIDRSDHVLVEGNRISDTTAEGIDIKEGTTGGVVRANTFRDAGTSGKNSADSWVDVKGNEWLVVGNSGSGTLLDAFQVHDVYDGWGLRNTFRGNSVTGGIPGFVVGIYPAKADLGNVVSCDNTGAGARAGRSNIACT